MILKYQNLKTKWQRGAPPLFQYTQGCK